MDIYTHTMTGLSRKEFLEAIPLAAFAAVLMSILFFRANPLAALGGFATWLTIMVIVYGFLIKDPQPRNARRPITAGWVTVGNLILLDSGAPASIRWFRYTSMTMPLIFSMLLPPERRSTITLIRGVWLGLLLGNIAYSMLK